MRSPLNFEILSAVFFFSCLAIFHTPYVLAPSAYAGIGDESSYLSHALTIGLDFDLNYANEPYLKDGSYDVVMPDVKYVGGPIKMLEIANYAKKYGSDFSPHNPSGPICHAHSLQICGVTDFPVILEHQFGESPYFDELVSNDLPLIKNSKIKLSNDPGIGVKINKNLNILKMENNFKTKNKTKNVFANIADLSSQDN